MEDSSPKPNLTLSVTPIKKDNGPLSALVNPDDWTPNWNQIVLPDAVLVQLTSEEVGQEKLIHQVQLPIEYGQVDVTEWVQSLSLSEDANRKTINGEFLAARATFKEGCKQIAEETAAAIQKIKDEETIKRQEHRKAYNDRKETLQAQLQHLESWWENQHKVIASLVANPVITSTASDLEQQQDQVDEVPPPPHEETQPVVDEPSTMRSRKSKKTSEKSTVPRRERSRSPVRPAQKAAETSSKVYTSRSKSNKAKNNVITVDEPAPAPYHNRLDEMYYEEFCDLLLNHKNSIFKGEAANTLADHPFLLRVRENHLRKAWGQLSIGALNTWIQKALSTTRTRFPYFAVGDENVQGACSICTKDSILTHRLNQGEYHSVLQMDEDCATRMREVIRFLEYLNLTIIGIKHPESVPLTMKQPWARIREVLSAIDMLKPASSQ